MNSHADPPLKRSDVVTVSSKRNKPRREGISHCLPFISGNITSAESRSIVKAQPEDDVVLVNIFSQSTGN